MNLNTLYKKLTNGKYIIGLLIGFVGIISFCNAELVYVNGNGNRYSTSSLRINAGSTSNIGPSNNKNLEPYATFCFSVSKDLVCSYSDSTFTGDNTTYCIFNNSTDNIASFNVSCTNNGASYKYIYYMSVLPLPSELFSTTCPTCPEVNTGEILSGYILESEIDTNYCVGNGLCPNECGSGEEMTGKNRSSIFINNIQYPGAPTIKFTIPEEIQREQNTDEEETNIDVIGYGYDQDKMQQMVNTQYYKPTAEEMSGLMEKVADYLPLVAIALLITRIRRVIKKVF